MAKQLGFYMNMQACYGCQTCEISCKSENKLPAGVRWRRVRKFTTDNPVTASNLSMACNHCDHPQCVKVCPAGAYSKRPDGIVIQDHKKCIGCRMCIMACPYNAPVYDPEEGKTSKCNLCAERLDAGLPPRCVDACPGKALEYGELLDLQNKYGREQAIVDSPSPHITNPSIVINPTQAKHL
jgi:DMSO reductase iron-sulfur subunit